jgi:hypothetical protein
VSPEEDTNEQFITDQQPRCEIGKVLIAGEECQRTGEVQLDGSRVCVHHAELLSVGERSENLIGTVFMMDQWLESVDGEIDEEHVRRVEQHRKEIVEQLRLNLTRISLIRDELLKDHAGTT